MHVFIWKYYFIPCFRVSATHYLLVLLFSWCTQYNNSQPSECRKYLVYRVLVFTQSAGLQCLWEIARWGPSGGEKENHSKCKAMIHATDRVQTKIISPQTPPLTSPCSSQRNFDWLWTVHRKLSIALLQICRPGQLWGGWSALIIITFTQTDWYYGMEFNNANRRLSVCVCMYVCLMESLREVDSFLK